MKMQNFAYICGEKVEDKYGKNKYHKVSDYCHYVGEY